MPELNRRLHILIKEDQMEFLKDLSERRKRPIGELVREAVEQTYRPHGSLLGLRALESLRESASLGPADWNEISANLNLLRD